MGKEKKLRGSVDSRKDKSFLPSYEKLHCNQHATKRLIFLFFPHVGGYPGDVSIVGTGGLQLGEFRHPWVSQPLRMKASPVSLPGLCFCAGHMLGAHKPACFLPADTPGASVVSLHRWDMEVYEEESMQLVGTGSRM